MKLESSFFPPTTPRPRAFLHSDSGTLHLSSFSRIRGRLCAAYIKDDQIIAAFCKHEHIGREWDTRVSLPVNLEPKLRAAIGSMVIIARGEEDYSIWMEV